MSEGKREAIRWAQVNPFNHVVVLRQDTFDAHICGDHPDTDAAARKLLEDQVPVVIEKPSIIYRDVKNEDNPGRYKYWGHVTIKGGSGFKIRGLLAVVETNRTPHEIVTWTQKDKIKDDCPEEALVYDARRGIVKNDKI